MSKRRLVQLAAFFLLFWLAVMLFSTTVHEVGHALTVALAGGWRNSLAFFGGADYNEPVVWLTMIEQVQASGLSPQEWGAEQNLRLMGEVARRLPPYRLGVMGGWLGQLAATLLAFLVVRSRVFQGGFILLAPDPDHPGALL